MPKLPKMRKGDAVAWAFAALHQLHSETCCKNMDTCERDVGRALRGLTPLATDPRNLYDASLWSSTAIEDVMTQAATRATTPAVKS